MPTLNDLTNKIFGKLTVISYAGKRKWNCQCSCNNLIQVRGDHLVGNKIKSCGCLRAPQDLTGKIFGEWAVLKFDENKKLWECRCNCGTNKFHQASNLLSGNTKSCGCLFKYDDIKGEKFGKLVPLLKIENKKYNTWVCLCDCGNHTTVLASNLKMGYTKSCGCIYKETAHIKAESSTIHGCSRKKVYRSYQAMMSRCYNSNAEGFKYYGGRRITVCDEWRENFINFLNDMGEPPYENYSIDRIDVNLGYCKENCKWSSPKEQARNRRNNKFITYNNITKTAIEWEELTGIKAATIVRRISKKWTIKDALETPSLRAKNIT